MKQPKPVVFVDSQEERAAMQDDYRRRKSQARREAVIWSTVTLALYIAQVAWFLTSQRMGARFFLFWVVGELLLILATAFSIAKLADSKSQTRWWAVIALVPTYGTLAMLVAPLFAVAGLIAMPVPPLEPNIKLRSESQAW